MTTITIQQDLGLGKNSFASLEELFSYLEDKGIAIVLHELSDNECTPETVEHAREVRKQYEGNPSSFLNV